MNNKNTVLIVEDQVPLLHALRDGMTHAGLTVIMAQNGKEGLKLALSEMPKLVLLDIVMPVMDGITMLEKLRADSRGKHIKVIILSNLSDSQKVADAIALGTHDYLVKSDWKMSDLVYEVKHNMM